MTWTLFPACPDHVYIAILTYMLRTFLRSLGCFGVLVGFFSGCSTPEPPSTALPQQPVTPAPAPAHFEPHTLREFQAEAARFHHRIAVPQFETNPSQILAAVTNTMDRAGASLDAISSCS